MLACCISSDASVRAGPESGVGTTDVAKQVKVDARQLHISAQASKEEDEEDQASRREERQPLLVVVGL